MNSGFRNTPQNRNIIFREIRNRIERRIGLTTADEPPTPVTVRLDREIASLNLIHNHMAIEAGRRVDNISRQRLETDAVGALRRHFIKPFPETRENR